MTDNNKRTWLSLGGFAAAMALLVLAWRPDGWPAFTYILLIAAANNVDNLGARIAYSIEGVKVTWLINLWISFITFFISAAAAYCGAVAKGELGIQSASVIAMLLLVSLGAWMIFEARKERRKGELRRAASVAPQTIIRMSLKEGTILGVALSINNIGGGLGAGMMGLSPFLIGFFSAAVSFIALWGGNYLADWCIRKNLADRAAVLGGVLMIAIGLKQIIA